jgi:hypothetical protein
VYKNTAFLTDSGSFSIFFKMADSMAVIVVSPCFSLMYYMASLSDSKSDRLLSHHFQLFPNSRQW